MDSPNQNLVWGPFVPIVRDDDRLVLDPKGIYDSNASPTSNTSVKRPPAQLLCVLPDDSIVEAPSLVTPFLLKKKTTWPTKIEINSSSTPHQNPESSNSRINLPQNIDPSTLSRASESPDEVQVVNVIPPVQRDNTSNVDTGTVHERQTLTLTPTPISTLASTPSPIVSLEEQIKAATVASLTTNRTSNTKSSPILTLTDYYSSSVGKFLLGIGLSRVSEYRLEQEVSKTAKKIRRSNTGCAEMIERLELLREDLKQARASNSAYVTKHNLQCPRCPFKSDFSSVMEEHLNKPHRLSSKKYACNWCDFKAYDSSRVVMHTLVEHKKRCNSEKPPNNHICTLCSYETNSKRKLLTHTNRCEQTFSFHDFLGPTDYGENDYPAITSKFITQTDIGVYEQTLKSLRLSTYNPYQLKVPVDQSRGAHRSLLIVQGQNRSRNQPQQTKGVKTSLRQESSPLMQVGNIGAFVIPSHSASKFNSSLGNSDAQSTSKHTLQTSPAQLLKMLAAQNTTINKNKPGILIYPKQNHPAFVNGKSVINSVSNFVMAPPQPHLAVMPGGATIRPQQNSAIDTRDDMDERRSSCGKSNDDSSFSSSVPPNPKGSTFVICEICDAYIKDLTQLKAHMQHIHNVKIHQKTLESRPPLNCQKCQWRFFTDEGIERHLLGVHGLVTSNLQDKVDQGKDSGRCTVCGRAYSEKLVYHMKEIHKTNLKPAHLTYKCTVCLATFNLYRLFENHVYSVHKSSS